MRALIIDDEPMPAKHLEVLINKYCFEIKAITIITSPVKAVQHLEHNNYDIIFLDVEMPEINGFELLEQVLLPDFTQVIFTTAYSQYAIEAFKANALHYILKMVTKDDLITAVRKVIRMKEIKSTSSEEKTNIISIYHNDEYHLLNENKIFRLEASKSYTYFITEDKKILSSKGIGYYQKKLSHEVFFRCHNSHLINILHLEKIGKGRNSYITLSNGDVIPLSDSKKEELHVKLNL
tara:strand:+ start:442 stop:1149 length:708 start_codon:yes stop_codon:yes gene_type:complete